MSQVTWAKVLAVGLGLSSPPEYTPSTQITPDSPGSHGEGMAAVTSASTRPGLLSGHVFVHARTPSHTLSTSAQLAAEGCACTAGAPPVPYIFVRRGQSEVAAFQVGVGFSISFQK